MSQLQPQFKNPATADPQVMFKWAQDLITQLRNGSLLSNIPSGGAPGVFVAGKFFPLTPNNSSAVIKTANTASLQAAIDYAYANALQVIQISAGVFWCDPGIYLDPPGNLRSTPSTPTIFSFSLHLRGAGGLGNHEGHGTQLKFTDNTTNTLIVGTGQGMRVSDLSILGPSGASSRAALPANGIGIALAGGSGGLSRSLLERVMVENFRQGVVTGYNNPVLCDSLTMFKCYIANCFRGVNINQAQNYINSLVECTFGNNTTHVYSALGKAVNVWGGNYSTTSVNKNAFTIGSTSALTAFTDNYQGNNFTNWTFTTTLSADDQPMIDGSYDALVIKTVGFGVIPLVLTNYNSGTKVATLKFYPAWVGAQFLVTDLKNNTDIQTDLAAATLLYACETITVFYGTGINVHGVHTENPGALTRLLTTEAAFNGDRVSRIHKLFANYNINQADQASGTNAQKAVFYCQQVFPFLRQVQAGIVMEDCMLENALTGVGLDGINIEVNVSAFHRLISQNCDLFHPNLSLAFDLVGNQWPSRFHGAGEWDSTPFLAGAESASRYYAAGRQNSVPFQGWRPAQWATARLTPAQINAIANGPGSLGSYPSLHGETMYSVLDENIGAPTATIFARSGHKNFSYGQNLTINWSYKGQSNVVTMSDLTRMYAGLRIILDDGTDGPIPYIVTGVYPTLGYVTVVNPGGAPLVGTKTTTFSGTVVQQETYSIGRSGTLPATQFNTNSGAGAQTAAIGDLTGAVFVNLKLTAVGANNYTTRTATQMFGDILGAYAGMKYMLSIQNTNAGTTTLVGGTGVTVNGTAAIAQNTARLFEVEFPTITTCTITSLGVTATL